MRPSIENGLEHQSCHDGLKLKRKQLRKAVSNILMKDLFNCVNDSIQEM